MLWKKKKKLFKDISISNFWILSLGHPTESFLIKKKKNCRGRFSDILGFRKWRPLEQTKTKNGRHFFISTFDNLQLCFFCTRFLHYKGPNIAICFWLGLQYGTLHIQSEMFLIMAQPKTNCNFRTFRVEESFWTKKQSCKLWKVGKKKCSPFFVFVRFNGCHFT